MTQWQVGSASATQVVYAGSPETLIVNKNTKYTVLLGNDSAVGSGNQSDATPLGPYESLVVNGLEDMFAIAQMAGTSCLVVTQTNAVLWTPQAVQPNISDPHSGYTPGLGAVGVTLNVPPRAQGLLIGWSKVGGTVSYFTGLTVTGNQSGLVYANVNPSAMMDQEIWVPILSDIDTTVTLTTIMSATVAVPAVVWIMVPFMAGLVSSGQIGDVNIAGVSAGGGAVPVTFNGASQPVFFNGLNNLGLVANQAPIQINQSLAAGATGVIIPAVGGRQLFLHSIRIEVVATVAFDCDIQDTSGSTIGTIFQQIIGAPAATFRPAMGDTQLHGAPLATGLGVQLKNSGGAAQQFVGLITASW